MIAGSSPAFLRKDASRCMKKNDPPIHAIAAVTWSQRNSAEPHSQPKVSSAPINQPPRRKMFAPVWITIKAAAAFG